MIKIKSILISAVSAVMLFGVCAATAGCAGNDKVDNLQQQIAELESKLGEQNDKISDMQEEIDNQNGEIADLQEKLDEQTKVNIELKAENSKLENEFNVYTGIMSELVDQNTLSGFYSLTQAYYYGLLTRADIMSIAYYHNGGTKYNEDVMGDNFTPLPKTPEVLSEEVDTAIRQAYYDEYISNHEVYSFEDTFTTYYGTYNNCVAVMVWCRNMPYNLAIGKDVVRDVTCFYSNNNSILIWVNN